MIWQRSKDGAKGRNFPKPIPRPGESSRDGTRRIGSPAPISEIIAACT
ncbi:DUF5361 domain-containing protein [Aerococcus mictus]